MRDLPQGWTWLAVRDLGRIVGGLTKGKKRLPGVRLREVPYLRVANVQRGSLDLTEIKLIEATEVEISELQLLPGDVLFNEGGDRDKLGRGCVWNGELPICIHQNHVFRLRVYDEFSPQYISTYANSLEAQHYFLGSGKQTTNLASINLTRLGELPIPTPPLNEQRRIVAKLESLQAYIRRAREALARIEGASAMHAPSQHNLGPTIANLERSLLAKAFRGELVPQDPTDEPAEAMLARVRGTAGATRKPGRGKRGVNG
jgi:type I restriction enzyme S subunit